MAGTEGFSPVFSMLNDMFSVLNIVAHVVSPGKGRGEPKWVRFAEIALRVGEPLIRPPQLRGRDWKRWSKIHRTNVP
jgi:hypothetical protein